MSQKQVITKTIKVTFTIEHNDEEDYEMYRMEKVTIDGELPIKPLGGNLPLDVYPIFIRPGFGITLEVGDA